MCTYILARTYLLRSLSKK